jgi:hypothetical protein
MLYVISINISPFVVFANPLPVDIVNKSTSTVAVNGGSTGILPDYIPTVTVNAPTNASLGNVPYATSDKQIIKKATAGSVDTLLLEGYSYTLTVKCDVTKLTNGSNTFANPLMIATGAAGDTTVGNINAALALTQGYRDYSGSEVDNFMTVTTNDSLPIGGERTDAISLELILFQKVDNHEHLPGGTYSLILTYTVTAVLP